MTQYAFIERLLCVRPSGIAVKASGLDAGATGTQKPLREEVIITGVLVYALPKRALLLVFLGL